MPAADRAGHRIAHRLRGAAWLDLDFCFVFVTFATALLALRLPLVAPANFILLLLGYGATRPERLSAAAARCGPILVLPALCLLSTLWSHVPVTTLYYASEYLLTVVFALLIGSSMAGSSVLNGMFGAFLLYAVVTVLIGLRADVFHPGSFGRDPFAGLAASKNVAGDVAALAVMIGLTMLIRSARRKRPAAASLSLILMLLGVILAIAAVSTGALASLVVGVIVIGGVSFIVTLPVAARSTALVAGTAAAAIAALTQKIWFEPLFASVLKAGGKNATFTGRTYIWSRAEVLIESRPVLGLGLNAFWIKGNLEAEAIWRRLYIPNRNGFNFHNTRLDILVHLGYVGLALFVVIFATYGAILLVRNLRAPTPTGTLFVALLCYEASRMGFETVTFGLFSHTTLLLYAVLGWGVRQRMSMAAAEPDRPAIEAGGSRRLHSGQRRPALAGHARARRG